MEMVTDIIIRSCKAHFIQDLSYAPQMIILTLKLLPGISVMYNFYKFNAIRRQPTALNDKTASKPGIAYQQDDKPSYIGPMISFKCKSLFY